MLESDARFEICHSGRRSGKTEVLGKRKPILKLLDDYSADDLLYVFCAPTRDQAKRIYWNDLQAMIPPGFVKRVWHSELTIELQWNTRLMVVGMDRPERIEGIPVDHAVVDEFGNMKPESWTHHLRPALSTPGRPGSASFIGVPEGRNHYYDLCESARTLPDWAIYWWPSVDVLDPEEIEAARRELDPRTFRQEYEGSFETFAGRAYYAFERELHATHRLAHRPDAPLIFCFDFNVSPGVAVIAQEQSTDWYRALHDVTFRDTVQPEFTAVIGEVWIRDNSTTPMVCRKLIEDWAEKHTGEIHIYGDVTGGARGTAKLQGTDWQIIRQELVAGFGNRVRDRVPRSNPREKDRVNAVNRRLLNTEEQARILVDPETAPHVVKDLEGVCVVEGSAGDLDKSDQWLTHISDALGYYIHARFPVVKHAFIEEPL
jgi:hypothetical protein